MVTRGSPLPSADRDLQRPRRWRRCREERSGCGRHPQPPSRIRSKIGGWPGQSLGQQRVVGGQAPRRGSPERGGPDAKQGLAPGPPSSQQGTAQHQGICWERSSARHPAFIAEQHIHRCQGRWLAPAGDRPAPVWCRPGRAYLGRSRSASARSMLAAIFRRPPPIGRCFQPLGGRGRWRLTTKPLVWTSYTWWVQPAE